MEHITKMHPYSYPALLILSMVRDVLLTHHRSFHLDSLEKITGQQPEVSIQGCEFIPADGPCVVTFDHHHRSGFQAWLLNNPVVTAPIIGPRTLQQLTGSLRALEIQLGEESLKKLDEIRPGPGGEAPEAYAW